MSKYNFLAATIAQDAEKTARRFGFGLELDEFCTAANMDGDGLDAYLPIAERIAGASENRVFHAPFSEIFPSAVDPKMRALALERLNQAFGLAYKLGYKRIVMHSGFMPRVYFKEWFLERSAEFWREFLADKPGDTQFMVENVLDEEPRTLRAVIDAVNDPRLGLCFDMGHANIVTEEPLKLWVEVFGARLYHVHAHNNFGRHDTHNEIFNGSIAMAEMLAEIKRASPGASITLETIGAESSALWLRDNGFLEE